jgi:uncharacterized protein YdaU (DUF1376 family)
MKSFNGKKPNFQKWDEQSFTIDTTHLDWLDRLLYRALLQKAWYISARPNLPDNDAELRKVLGGVPEDIWKEHKTAVRSMFRTASVNGAAVLTQKRLQEDWGSLEAYRTQQAEFGKKAHAEKKDVAPVPVELPEARPDADEVVKAVYVVCGKPPATEDVSRLLQSYSVDTISDAFDNFYRGLDEHDATQAEFIFFKREHGSSGKVICDVWLKNHPAEVKS